MYVFYFFFFFFFSSRRRHTRWPRDWSSDVCSSDLRVRLAGGVVLGCAIVATGSRSGMVGAFAGLAASELVRSRDPWAAALRPLYATSVATLAGVAALMTDRGWRAAQTLW